MKPFSVGKNLVADTKTTLYVIPSNYFARWTLLYAHNATAQAKNFSAWWYDKSADTEIPIVDNYQLASKAYLKFDGSYVLLEEGDEIRVKVESGATSSVVVTVELEQKNATGFN